MTEDRTDNLARILDATASRTPDAVAMTFDGREFTYSEIASLAHRTAAMLSSFGVVKGDRVAVWLPNHPAFATAMYGAWRIGATVVPLHAGLTEREAKHILSDSGASVVFCGPDQFEKAMDKLIADLPALEHIVPVERAAGTGEFAPVEVPPISEVGEDDLALIQYTAGTSGVPKGAMLTHGNLHANIDQMRQVPIAIGPEDVALCVLPLFHIFGLNVVLNMGIEAGARIVLSARFDAAAALDAIRANQVTVICGAPPVFVAWLALPDAPRDAFSNVRVAVSGAAPLTKEVLNGFRERFDVTIWEGYGLTETSPALTSTAIGGVPKPVCVGRPLPGVELRIVDDDGDDIEDVGDPGEIVVRGPNVFKGYWNKPKETEAAFIGPGGTPGTPGDGWFRTGDIGVLDDDGDLFIVDRSKDLVIVSGFNVYPREVEDVLRKHPNVGDVAVVGVHDDKTGERVRAIVVADPPGESVTEDVLIEYCRKSLAPYKIPKEIEVVSDIPRNAAGKVLRRELRVGTPEPD
jgi:long-chain acyl-CoA synthetase